jgi:hypothetical protein
MDLQLEREYAIDNMADSLFDQMKSLIKVDQQLDALAICEEWLVDGKDPQDGDYKFVFLKNFTLEDN